MRCQAAAVELLAADRRRSHLNANMDVLELLKTSLSESKDLILAIRDALFVPRRFAMRIRQQGEPGGGDSVYALVGAIVVALLLAGAPRGLGSPTVSAITTVATLVGSELVIRSWVLHGAFRLLGGDARWSHSVTCVVINGSGTLLLMGVGFTVYGVSERNLLWWIALGLAGVYGLVLIVITMHYLHRLSVWRTILAGTLYVVASSAFGAAIMGVAAGPPLPPVEREASAIRSCLQYGSDASHTRSLLALGVELSSDVRCDAGHDDGSTSVPNHDDIALAGVHARRCLAAYTPSYARTRSLHEAAMAYIDAIDRLVEAAHIPEYAEASCLADWAMAEWARQEAGQPPTQRGDSQPELVVFAPGTEIEAPSGHLIPFSDGSAIVSKRIAKALELAAELFPVLDRAVRFVEIEKACVRLW